jgi:TrmH family RNA methyltransferase
LLTKNQLKYYSSLHLKKNRKEEKKFFVEGKRIVDEGLKSDYECELVILSNSFKTSNPDILKQLINSKIRFELLKEEDFEKLCLTKNPQGIAAVFYKKNIDQKSYQHSKLIVALENISDPGNEGTIIRNSDWFGINEILIGENCVELFNPKVIRSTMGSVFHLNIFEEENLLLKINLLKAKGYQIVCSDINGDNLFEFKPLPKTLVIFSSEAFGPSSEITKLSDKIITIPKKGRAESLNIASASAVILSHLSQVK